MLALAVLATASAFENCAVISDTYDWKLFWSVSGATVDFEMVSTTTGGFMAIGLYQPDGPDFSPQTGHPGMSDSTFVDLWVVLSQGGLVDGWMNEDDPETDDRDDLTNAVVEKNATHLIARWSRALAPDGRRLGDDDDSGGGGGAQDNPIVLGAMSRMLYSCHPTRKVRKQLDDDLQHKSDCFGTLGIDFASSSCDPPAVENGAFASASGDFRLEWVPSAADEGSLDFKVVAQTTGWVAVGFSATPNGHDDVDVVQAAVSGGTLTLQDSYLNGFGTAPVVADTSQDVTSTGGEETGGTTTVKFTRKIATGDAQDQDLSGDVVLHYAYATEDDFTVMHAVKNKAWVNLLSTNGSASPPPIIAPGPPPPSAGDPVVVEGATSYTSADGAFELAWEKSDDEKTLNFTATFTTTGWVAVGFSSTAVKHDAVDVVFGYVDGGTVKVVDAYMNGFAFGGEAAADASDDLLAPSGEEADGKTTIRWARAVTTADTERDCDLSREVALHWAYGTDDPSAGGSPAQHAMTTRGLLSLDLLAGETATVGGPGKGGDTPVVIANPDGGPASGGDDWKPEWQSPDGTFTLTWERPDADSITFTMSAQATGWVGAGFSLGLVAHMDTDMVLGAVDGSGAVSVQDSWSASMGPPPVADDDGSDVSADGGSEVGGTTTVTFTRPVVPADLLQDVSLAGGLVTLQWAYHVTSDTFTDTHSGRGYANINLNGPPPPPPPIDNAGEGLLFTVLTIVGLHLLHRHTHKLFKCISAAQATRAREIAELREERDPVLGRGRFSSVAGELQRSVTSVSRRVSRASVRRPSTAAPVRISVDGGEGDGVKLRGATVSTGSGDLRRIEEASAAGLPPSAPPSPPGGGEPPLSDLKGPRDRVMTTSTPKAAATPFSLFVHSMMLHRLPNSEVHTFEAVLFALYVLINLGWAFVWNDPGWRYPNSLGYLATANALFVVVPAGRTSMWAVLLGLPFDKTIQFHRWIGRLIVALATAHFVWYLVEWILAQATSELPGCALVIDANATVACAPGAEQLLNTVSYAFGLFAWLALAVVFTTSLEKIRRKHYYVFYASHFSFAIFYAAAAAHKPAQFGPYALGALGLYGIDKLSRLLRGILSTAPAVAIDKLPSGVVRIKMRRPWFTQPELGQYVFISLPGVSKFEWHPFTLASSPKEPYMEVCVKALGNFTKQLHEFAESGATPIVRVDGPYGHLTKNPHRYEGLVLVSGGIGVTPMIAMLRYYFLYNVSARVALSTPIHLARHITFVWTIPDMTMYDTFREQICWCYKRSGTPGYPTLHLHIYVTRQKDATADAFALQPGDVITKRPDMAEVLKGVKEHGIPRVAVLVCGPGPLVKGTWDASKELSDSNTLFDYHHETFEF